MLFETEITFPFGAGNNCAKGERKGETVYGNLYPVCDHWDH